MMLIRGANILMRDLDLGSPSKGLNICVAIGSIHFLRLLFKP